jgi:uncharacterized protein YcfL
MKSNKMITYTLLCWAAIVTAGCSSFTSTPQSPNQELIVDKQVQPMGRNEVIDAVRQCESSGLRAIPLYAKRKINGYTVETVVEVTCGPKYAY